MAPYRVLVVDDSAFMRKIICDLIEQDKQFTVAATAKTGAEALLALRQHKPDVITMDLEMPEMNGLEALQQIMKIRPTPVIMLSGISEDGTRETIKALQLGAFDFIRKPSTTVSAQEVGQSLLEKMNAAVLAAMKPSPSVKPTTKRVSPPGQADEVKPRPVTDPRRPKPTGTVAPKDVKPRPPVVAPPPARSPIQPVARPSLPHVGEFSDIVAVGTSTGGPRALHQLIADLPAHFPAPVLVVQHMPPKFTRSLAQRLDSFSKLRVVEAEQGQQVKAGMVYIAPGGHHMQLAERGGQFYLQLSDDPPRNGHRPSVDVLFESLLSYPRLRRHTVIMTGMGSDGAKAMKQLVEQGIPTAVAEAEETCVVFGMPRSAIECGAAHTVLPLQEIAGFLVSVVDRKA